MGADANLRERILADFGVVLPLTGGQGVIADPYILDCDSVVDAANVQLQLLRLLGKGRQQPWRLREVGIHSEAGAQLVRAAIERLELNEKERITEQASYYFLFPRIRDPASLLTVANAGGHADPRSGICVPFQLGWLHLDRATDNERDSPGLGWTAVYEAAGMEGAVFVYDEGERLASDDVESERVVVEFRRAVADALNANPAAEIKHQVMFRDAVGRGRCLLAILDLPGDSMTAVMLTARNGCFVKLRLTFDATEREFGRMAHESMEAFVDAMRPQAMVS